MSSAEKLLRAKPMGGEEAGFRGLCMIFTVMPRPASTEALFANLVHFASCDFTFDLFCRFGMLGIFICHSAKTAPHVSWQATVPVIGNLPLRMPL